MPKNSLEWASDQFHKATFMLSSFTTPARTYALKVDKFVCNKFGIAEFFAKAMAASPVMHGMKVLDVGCGVGPLMILLSDQYKASTTGVELNASACKCCKENLNRLGLSDSSTVFEGLFTTFERTYPSEKFDLIVSNPPLDENITTDEISFYNAKDFMKPDSDTFSYMTNSWHDENGHDLLDQIFAYADRHLTSNGEIAIAFCEIDGASLNSITLKATKFEFQLIHSDVGCISPASIGAEKIQSTDIIAHYAVFKRSTCHEHQDS